MLSRAGIDLISAAAQHPEAQSSLCIALGTAQLDADGELREAVNIHSPFDLQALLVSAKMRPCPCKDVTEPLLLHVHPDCQIKTHWVIEREGCFG